MTILGKHTVAELRELVADKDFAIQQTLALYKSSNWTQCPARADWDWDWKNFFERYSTARSTAKQKMFLITAANPLVGPSVMPAEEEYQLILRAITKSGTGLYVKGDLPDLQQRLQNAVRRNIDYSGRPGYSTTDLDMVAYKKADGTVKVIEATGTQVQKNLTSGPALLAFGAVGIVGAAVIVAKLK